MSQDELFDRLNTILVAFIRSTDAMKKSVEETSECVLWTGQWTKCEELEKNINSLKKHSDGMSGSCTKLSLVDLASMPLDGLQSLFDEILGISQGLISSAMALFGMKLSRPLFDDVHKLVKAELTQVHGLVLAIHSHQFEKCMAPIGQVWEINDSIQKLPVTNKAAYRRALMSVLKIVKDTHREFQEGRDDSVKKSDNKDLDIIKDGCRSDNECGDNMGENWGLLMDDDDDSYSSEELPYVDVSLSIMKKSFACIKLTMEMMSILSEQLLATLRDDLDRAQVTGEVQQWVATVFNLDKHFSNMVTNLGMELYTPLSFNSLKEHYDDMYTNMMKVKDMMLEANYIYERNSSEACEDKMRKLLSESTEIVAVLENEKELFRNLP